MKHTLPRLTIPAIVVGALFLGVCLVSIRYIHRLQADLADVLAKNVASLQAAQELEIRVRQLRFHNFLYLLNPKDERLTRIDQDQKRFEEGLETARDAASTAEDREQIRLIDEGYREYKREQDKLREETLARQRVAVAPCPRAALFDLAAEGHGAVLSEGSSEFRVEVRHGGLRETCCVLRVTCFCNR